MNMLIPHRRSGRRRQAPKRFEDEKFVSGRVDQYTRGYEGRDSNWRAAEEDAENYYHTRKGRKFANYVWNGRGKYRVQLRDFPESLLELTSIWRDLDMVLPSAIVSHIGGFLRLSQTDKDLLVDDDEFIAGDDSESECEEQGKRWSCSGLPKMKKNGLAEMKPMNQTMIVTPYMTQIKNSILQYYYLLNFFLV